MIKAFLDYRALDEDHSDVDYPAYTRGRIRRSYDALRETAEKAFQAQASWQATPGYGDVCGGLRPPDEAEKSLLREFLCKRLQGERQLRFWEFMIEANLRVKCGTWTIAQAHYYGDSLDSGWAVPEPGDVESELYELLEAWAKPVPSYDDPVERTRKWLKERQESAFGRARSDFMEAWKKQEEFMNWGKLSHFQKSRRWTNWYA